MKAFDLDRALSAEERRKLWNVLGYELYEALSLTPRMLVKELSGIGYGGHFAETSDEEWAAYAAVTQSDEELAWLWAARSAYCKSLEKAAAEWEVPDPYPDPDPERAQVEEDLLCAYCDSNPREPGIPCCDNDLCKSAYVTEMF